MSQEDSQEKCTVKTVLEEIISVTSPLKTRTIFYVFPLLSSSKCSFLLPPQLMYYSVLQVPHLLLKEVMKFYQSKCTAQFGQLFSAHLTVSVIFCSQLP